MSQSAISRCVADTTTGEVHLVAKEGRAPYGYPLDPVTGKRYMTLGAVAAREALAGAYSAATLRVLLYVVYTCDTSAVVHQTQEQIAEGTHLTQSAVSKALRRLIADELLYRIGKSILLSPGTAYTGSGAEHQKAIARMPEHLRDGATVRHLHPVS